MPDPFQLSRFVAAQEPAYEHARRELRAGAKTGHWMWFIFPQLDGFFARLISNPWPGARGFLVHRHTSSSSIGSKAGSASGSFWPEMVKLPVDLTPRAAR